MIHKPHLSIVTLIWALVVTGLLWFVPPINHVLAWLNWGVIFIAVLVAHFCGGNPHSPSNLVGWSAFGVYTIFYLLVLLILYAIAWEKYLLSGFCIIWTMRNNASPVRNPTPRRPWQKSARPLRNSKPAAAGISCSSLWTCPNSRKTSGICWAPTPLRGPARRGP